MWTCKLSALAQVTKLVAGAFTASFALVTLDQVAHGDLERLTLVYLGSAAIVCLGAVILHFRLDGRVARDLSVLDDPELLRARLMSRDPSLLNAADLEHFAAGFWRAGTLDLHALVRGEQERRERLAQGRLTLVFALFAFVFAMMILFRVEVLPYRDDADQCEDEDCSDMQASVTRRVDRVLSSASASRAPARG